MNIYLSPQEIRALKAAVHTLAARFPHEAADNPAYALAYEKLCAAQLSQQVG